MSRVFGFISHRVSVMVAVALLVSSLGVSLVAPQTTHASSDKQSLCKGTGGTWTGSECVTPDGNRNVSDILGSITNILLFVVGAVSVIMIIVGGLKYVTSGGDQASITSAKNTILYAIVGLIVAFAAYAVVRFVILRF